MNDSLDDVLQRYFDDVARHDRLGDTPLRVVMRRGQRRRARRRTSAMAGTLVVGALGSVVAVRTLSGGDNSRKVQVGNEGSDGSGGDGTPTPVPTEGRVEPVPSPLVWNEVTVGSAEAIGIGNGLLRDPGSSTYYALSTEPGRTVGAASTLYRSDDGLRWAQTGTPPELTNRSELAATAGRLYAVGTQAASAPVSGELPWETTAAVSDDGGETWSEQSLPFDLADVLSLPFVRDVGVRSSVAGTSGRVVVAAVSHAALDTDAVAPPGVDGDTLSPFPDAGGLVEYEVTRGPCDRNAPATTPATTAALESSVPDGECSTWQRPARLHTWAELNVPAETVAATLGELRVAVSTDGGGFTEVTTLPVPDGWYIDSPTLHAVGDGFLLAANLNRATDPLNQDNPGSEQQVIAFTSPDGTTWTPVAVPVAWIERAGQIGTGQLAVFGSTGEGTVVAVQQADGTWHTTALDALLPAGADPNSMMMAVSAPVIGEVGVAAVVQLGDSMPTGPETTEATEDGVATTVAVAASGAPRYVLMFSPDGVDWSVEPLDALTAGRFVSGLATLDGGQLVIDASSGYVPAEAGGALPDRTLLVGTLTG